MFCQHTEPAVYYYTCRVSSSCDDLKFGEYTTTQDTFRILLNNIYKTKTHPIFHWYLFWNVKLLVVYFLVVFIGKPCHVCKYQPWLTNEYHQKKMIFSIFDCCPPSFLTCVGWRRSCRWDLHISLPSLSLLYYNLGLCALPAAGLTSLHAFSLGEEEAGERVSDGNQHHHILATDHHRGLLSSTSWPGLPPRNG